MIPYIVLVLWAVVCGIVMAAQHLWNLARRRGHRAPQGLPRQMGSGPYHGVEPSG